MQFTTSLGDMMVAHPFGILPGALNPPISTVTNTITPDMSQSCHNSYCFCLFNPHETTSQSLSTYTSPGANLYFKHTPSNAEQEWNHRKATRGESNDVIDELMRYEGLEQVKQQFLDIKSKIDVSRQQGRVSASDRFSVVFQGNPGTGKTTVARLYARLLESLQVLECSACGIKETSGIKIAIKGSQNIKRKMKKMVKWGEGGVLLIDEAYQLTSPYLDGVGRPALDVILTTMENNINKLAVIFVGYKNEMESFFEHNPGLSSRIPYTLNFEDFTEYELWKILRKSIADLYDSKMHIEGGVDGLYMHIATRRLASSRNRRGFGNARAVQNLLSIISQRQAQRLIREQRSGGYPDCHLLTKEDLLGPEPSTAIQTSEAWHELQRLIGLEQVKECVTTMMGSVKLNYYRELKGLTPIMFSLNQVFVGQPGTGKTTVAKLYGRILADLGCLSRGDVVLKTAADFIGNCLGQSESQTKGILDASVGKVLVIDEAYMLDPGDSNKDENKFKAGVIDTLVSIVQGTPFEDRCIILIGYEDKIRDMFHNANPGLARRFPVEQPFHFKDYSAQQLEQILRLKMDCQDLTYTDQAMDAARDICKRALMRPNCTNAGEVDRLLETAKMNYTKRLLEMPFDDQDSNPAFEATDFDDCVNRGLQIDLRKRLGGLVHKSIADQVVDYQISCLRAKSRGIDPSVTIPTGFIFEGPPGTGKSTTAQAIGELFYSMGHLLAPTVLEYSMTDLMGQYVGHTVPKTRKKLLEAVGRVVLINVSCATGDSTYAGEAINELTRFLAQPSRKNRMILVLAGTSKEIGEIMKHPGLSSIVSEDIQFENIPPEDCIGLLVRELERRGFTHDKGFLTDPSSPDYVEIKRQFDNIQSAPGWTNAHDVKTLSSHVTRKCFMSEDHGSQGEWTVSPAHITSCMTKIVTQRKRRAVGTGSNSINPALQQQQAKWATDPGSALSHLHSAQPPSQSTTRQDRSPYATAPAKRSCEDTETSRNSRCKIGKESETTIQREEGVTDANWQALLEAKKKGIEANAQIHAEIERIEQERQKIGNELTKGEDHNLDQHLKEKCDDFNGRLQALKKIMQEEKKVQIAIQKMGRCKYGYNWIHVAGGYRCEGGTHFVSEGEVQARKYEYIIF